MINNEPVHINGDGLTSRDFCYIDNAVQMHLIAVTSNNSDATNQVYNVAVGDRTTLNELCEHLRSHQADRFPYLNDFKPIYCDFCAGDIRHSIADVSKANQLLGYEPSHRIGEGLGEVLSWHTKDTSEK